MERFVKGDVVVVPFPFSDLSNTKRRPALVVATLEGDDLILCQITSQQGRSDRYAIPLQNDDFMVGDLDKPSLIRPNFLFTADHNIILYKAGRIKKEKWQEVARMIVGIIGSER